MAIIYAETESDIYNASVLIYTEDVTLHIAKSITLANEHQFYGPAHELIIAPGGQTLKWDKAARGVGNGFIVRCKSWIVNGLRAQGFYKKGDVFNISADEVQNVEVLGCEFTDCHGDLTRAVGSSVSDASQANYGLVIAFHFFAGVIRVQGCTFRRCCSDEAWWSHCLYGDGRCYVTQNQFIDCGSIASIGANVASSFIIEANTFDTRDGVLSLNPSGNLIHPYLIDIGIGSRFVFRKNTVRGRYEYLYYLTRDPGLTLPAENDYRGCEFTQGMVLERNVGVVAPATWLSEGYDRWSLMPS